MKTKFLNLTKPCTENWENMTPDTNGHFCGQCAKTVIDFTNLNQREILRLMKNSNGNICARATKTQMMQPLFEEPASLRFEFPYPGIAAGLMIATTLAAVQPMQAQDRTEKTAWMQVASSKKTNSPVRQTVPETQKSNNFIVLQGKVTTKAEGNPIQNAQIMLVTVAKQIAANTAADGTFSLKIPSHLIDDDNVVRVSYANVAYEKAQDNTYYFDGYESEDYILTRAQIKTTFKVQAEERMLVLGGMRYRSENYKPMVFVNGEDVKYKEFEKAQYGQRSTVDLKNKEVMYFYGDFARALYGSEAKDGLYIVMDAIGKRRQ